MSNQTPVISDQSSAPNKTPTVLAYEAGKARGRARDSRALNPYSVASDELWRAWRRGYEVGLTLPERKAA